MNSEYFIKLGEECFNNMRELNPKGGIKEFIRMAVEFGYKQALKDFENQNKEDEKNRKN